MIQAASVGDRVQDVGCWVGDPDWVVTSAIDGTMAKGVIAWQM